MMSRVGKIRVNYFRTMGSLFSIPKRDISLEFADILHMSIVCEWETRQNNFKLLELTESLKKP